MSQVLKERRRYDRLATEDGDTSLHYYQHAGPDLRLKALLRKLLPLRPRKVIEIGCADGHVLGALREMFGPMAETQYYGTDISLVSLKRARGKNFQSVVLSDAGHLPFKVECCDLVLASQVLEHLPDHRQALRQAHELLIPGGHLALTIPLADWFKLYKGLIMGSRIKFIDDETHYREWSAIPFQRFTGLGRLLEELDDAGFEQKVVTGAFYGSWRLEKAIDQWFLKNHLLYGIATWLDRLLGRMPGLKLMGRYAIITARKRQRTDRDELQTSG